MRQTYTRAPRRRRRRYAAPVRAALRLWPNPPTRSRL